MIPTKASVAILSLVLLASVVPASRCDATPLLTGTLSGVITSGGDGTIGEVSFHTGDRFLASYCVADPREFSYPYEFAFLDPLDAYFYLDLENLTTGQRTPLDHRIKGENLFPSGVSDDGWQNGSFLLWYTYDARGQAKFWFDVVNGSITGRMEFTTDPHNITFIAWDYGIIESGTIAVLESPEPSTLFSVFAGIAGTWAFRRLRHYPRRRLA